MTSEIRRGELFPGFEIASTDTVLDVGCGAGGACVGAGGLGCDVIGIDVEPLELRRTVEAMRLVPARSFRPILSDCDPIPLPDAAADVVVAMEVMEHVDDPRRFLAELLRVGRPGARYLISVPDAASEDIMKVVAPAYYFEKPVHQHIFGRQHLDELLQSAGLTVEGRAYCNFYWAMWWIFRMALGSDYLPGSPAPPPQLLADWERTWKGLEALPNGALLASAFDRAIPKSQVVMARKAPVAAGRAPSLLSRAWRKCRPGAPARRAAGAGVRVTA